MKFRSLLLFACMIVVPLLAMFSHKIPPALRQAARTHLWEPARRAIVGEPAAPQPAAIAGMPVVTVDVPVDKPSHASPSQNSAAPPGTIQSPEVRASEVLASEEGLAALGAFAVECAPVAGDGSLHRCSCRVAADPSGQLQRVFQSSGNDPAAAMQDLLVQVRAWKERMAANPPPASASARFQ